MRSSRDSRLLADVPVERIYKKNVNIFFVSTWDKVWRWCIAARGKSLEKIPCTLQEKWKKWRKKIKKKSRKKRRKKSCKNQFKYKKNQSKIKKLRKNLIHFQVIYPSVLLARSRSQFTGENISFLNCWPELSDMSKNMTKKKIFYLNEKIHMLEE